MNAMRKQFARLSSEIEISRGVAENNSSLPPLAVYVICILTLASGNSEATPALTDQLDYEGEQHAVSQRSGNIDRQIFSSENGIALVLSKPLLDHGWLTLPPSDKLKQMRRNERCSAMGGPVGIWKISDGKLWLTGLYRCSGKVTLEKIYGGSGEPIFANWITDVLVTQRGKQPCRHPTGFEEFEKYINLKIESGVLTAVREESNPFYSSVANNTSGSVIPLCQIPASK